MNSSDAELVLELQIQKGRRDVYETLMRFFKVEISQELFDYLLNNDFLTLDNCAESDDDKNLGKIRKGLALMRDYCTLDQAAKLDLDRDYAKVFCGAGSTNFNSAFPFESVYTSEKRLLMQEARDEVVKWYAKYGLGKADKWKDCEDHLGVELEFLVYLIDQTIAALEEGDFEKVDAILKDQQGFMKEHLANWVPAFVEAVVKHGRTDFYKGAALVLEGYLLRDLY